MNPKRLQNMAMVQPKPVYTGEKKLAWVDVDRLPAVGDYMTF